MATSISANPAKADPKKAFLGVGLAFPPAADSRGAIALVAYEEDIRQSIQIILGTNPGERVMRPEFGAGLRDFVFEPANPSTIQRVQTRVREALIDWEPRINVQAVTVTLDPASKNALYISITYSVRATNTVANLVYPFFLQEGSGQ
jgi:phage baseplate assembly protein W